MGHVANMHVKLIQLNHRSFRNWGRTTIVLMSRRVDVSIQKGFPSFSIGYSHEGPH